MEHREVGIKRQEGRMKQGRREKGETKEPKRQQREERERGRKRVLSPSNQNVPEGTII